MIALVHLPFSTSRVICSNSPFSNGGMGMVEKREMKEMEKGVLGIERKVSPILFPLKETSLVFTSVSVTPSSERFSILHACKSGES